MHGKRAVLGFWLACAGCDQRPPQPGVVRSEHWGFEATVPEELNVVFAGPERAACDTLEPQGRVITLRPSGRDTATSVPDTVQVLFSRQHFEALAIDAGFLPNDSAGTWKAAGSEYSGPAQHWRGAGWEGLEGGGQTRVEYPDAEPDEPSYAFENFGLALGRFDRSGGCALVLRLYQRGDGPGAESLLRSVNLFR